MTDYFEVHGRDGAARAGELRLSDPLATPALVDDSVDDGGGLWAADREVPRGYRELLTVLPHRSFPAGTDETVQDAFAVAYPDVDYPSAAVVTSDTAADHGADVYILSDAPGFVGHAAAFRDEIIAAREALPPDTGLYLSGVATPRNAATLVYAGVDLLDAKRARVRGLQGFYLTREDEQFLADLTELPCSCPACRGKRTVADVDPDADTRIPPCSTARTAPTTTSMRSDRNSRRSADGSATAGSGTTSRRRHGTTSGSRRRSGSSTTSTGMWRSGRR